MSLKRRIRTVLGVLFAIVYIPYHIEMWLDFNEMWKEQDEHYYERLL